MKKTLHIFGRNPVYEIITEQPKNVLQVFIKDTGKGAFFDDIIHQARSLKVQVQKVPEKKLDDLVGDVNHQGVVAAIKEFIYADFHTWLAELDVTKNPAVLLLDELEDPHNVGAIIRSAVAFGISAVLVPKHRQSGITATVFKTSAGAVAHIPIVQIGNVNQTLEELKSKGFWSGGFTGEGDTLLHNLVFDTPFVFIVGSEGRGVGQKTLELCDFKVRIPMRDNVESLNVSVAAALACYEWATQKNRK